MLPQCRLLLRRLKWLSLLLVWHLWHRLLRPRVSLDHLYTSSDVDSLWGATYKVKQKTMAGFVLAFDKNLIRSAG